MDYREKVIKISEHLEKNPNDYESVISLLKANSKAIEQEQKYRKNMVLKRLSEIRNGMTN